MENLKEKLIELFLKSCNDFKISRAENFQNFDIPSESRVKILDFLPKFIRIGDKFFKSTNEVIHNYGYGFKYNDNPPLMIASYFNTYTYKYGTFFPLISYLFWDNYINRKKGNKFATDYVNKNEDAYYTDCENIFSKTITIEMRANFIIHGTLVSKLTEKEFINLHDELTNSIKKHDIFKLEERLKD